MLLGGVMLCFSQWCNGLYSSTITPPRNTNYYTTKAHKTLHHWETQTITLPRNTNHYATQEHKPLHHRGTLAITPPRNTNHYTTEEHNPLHYRATQTTTPLRNTNHYTTEEHKSLQVFQECRCIYNVNVNPQREIVIISFLLKFRS
jgi:hypothetical protein